MKLSKRNLGIALVACALAIFTLVQVSAQGSAETLSIAFIGASEGDAADRDRQLYQAAVLAAEQINAGDDDDRAGISGPNSTRYELAIVYYEADTIDDVLDALDDAVADGAVAVLGPQDKQLLTALADAGTPDVAVLTGQPDSPTRSRVFQLTASYDDYAQAAADYLADERGFTEIAVIASDTSTAGDAADAFKRATGDEVIVADLTTEADESNFLADARVIRNANAQAIFAWTLDAQMLGLLEALESVGWTGEVVAGGLSAEFAQDAGELADGLFMLTPWSSVAYDSASQAFVADYQARWEASPSDSAAVYYDAAYLLAEAVSRAGDSVSAIANRLSGNNDYVGVQGAYNRGTTDAVMLVEVGVDGQLAEAARYADGACATCLDIWWADTTERTLANSETFNIGLITTQSGPAKDNGQHIEQAARLALREINQAGGVVRSNTRYTLNLRVYSALDAAGASDAFQSAVDDGMQVIIGPDYNAQILTNLNAASNAGVVQLVSATSAQIAATDSSDAVLQLRATDETLVTTAADYLLNVRDLTRFAFVAVRADYGLDAADDFADAVEAADDGELILNLEHEITDADLTALAEQIAEADVEAVAVWSNEPSALALTRALADLGWDGVLVYGYLTQAFVDEATSAPFEVLLPTTWTAASGGWATRDFAARYSERYSAAPAAQSAAYYDAMYLIAAALEDSGTAANTLKNWFGNLDSFVGVQGTYTPSTYDNGELTRAVSIMAVRADGLSEVARYDDGECLAGCAD